MPPSPLPKLRKLCLSLPEAQEVEAWGEPTFRVRNKLFAMYAAVGHHTAGRPAVWIKAAPGNQPFMVAHRPDRFFVPPYVGTSGWVGVWLDAADWDELRELLADAWRLTAPKRLAAQLPDTEIAPAAPKSPARAKKSAKKSAVKKTTKKAVRKPSKQARR
jgi:hypothetical protein